MGVEGGVEAAPRSLPHRHLDGSGLRVAAEQEVVGAGHFLVHPRNTVHGIKSMGPDNLVYIALSTGV